MFRSRIRLYSNFFLINKQPLIILNRKYSKYIKPSSEIVKLSYTQYDPLKFNEESHERPYLIILHGLFGSKQNWKSLAKNFAQQLNTRVFTLVFIIPTLQNLFFLKVNYL
jgi:predicted alpha/beta-fold hydrolase